MAYNFSLFSSSLQDETNYTKVKASRLMQFWVLPFWLHIPSSFLLLSSFLLPLSFFFFPLSSCVLLISYFFLPPSFSSASSGSSASLLPCFLASLLPYFLTSLLPFFLSSLLPFFLLFFLPCILASLLPCDLHKKTKLR